MAQRALGAGMAVPRRRALFGLLDADGWGWASVKAFIWLVIIIFMLGYLPDRAYYLTVGRTVDLGVLVWSPINLCPPTNQTLPCPPPVGAVVPFEQSPSELALPGAADRRLGPPGRDPDLLLRRVRREDGADRGSTSPRRSAPATSTSGSPGLICPTRGPTRASRTSPGSIYVIGGKDASGKADEDRFRPEPRPADRRAGRVADGRQPGPAEERSEAAIAVTTDGLLLIGGRNAAGEPSSRP